jgi:hypothetical protein
VDNLTGLEKHRRFDDDDEDDDDEQEYEDDNEEDDTRHYGDEGFEDEYDEEEEEEDEDAWSDLGADIRPEESASHSRGGPSRSRPFPPVRDPPRPKARGKYPVVVEPPSGPPPRRGGRSTSRRPPRPRSVADKMDPDEFAYGRASQLPYHPAAPWGGVNIGYTGGQAHTAASGYVNPFVSRSLIYPCSTDAFGYGPADNPFSNEFFGAPRRNYRGMARNNELMPFNSGYPGYPPFGPYPTYPPYGYPYPPPPGPSPVPPGGSNKSTPAPPPPPAPAPPPPPPPPKEDPPQDPKVKEIHQMLLDQKKRELERITEEAKAKADAKRQAEEDKLDALQKLIEKHNKEQLEREKKLEE